MLYPLSYPGNILYSTRCEDRATPRTAKLCHCGYHGFEAENRYNRSHRHVNRYETSTGEYNHRNPCVDCQNSSEGAP
ncbi:hypothetical protein BBOMB_0315 [Bifidobacterium bombi DSM 19703]|uniref:Uncharacterized protein n=1 Tax=Bifidobacterium bombi DSM 19703 TaxID=1341695 RepID=A0A080N2F1_9BIFI|nr:hypothetical protein BBOMB_0315 [Bifidobacterium bombi DSM 19703]